MEWRKGVEMLLCVGEKDLQEGRPDVVTHIDECMRFQFADCV